jgi:hypothetical protein
MIPINEMLVFALAAGWHGEITASNDEKALATDHSRQT